MSEENNDLEARLKRQRDAMIAGPDIDLERTKGDEFNAPKLDEDASDPERKEGEVFTVLLATMFNNLDARVSALERRINKPATFAMPSEITEQIIALTDQRRHLYATRATRGDYAQLQVLEDNVEALIPGYVLVWHADIQAYGLFPDARCDGGRMSRFD